MFFFFFCLFIFRRHSTREAASGKVTYFILRAYTATANTGKIGRGFGKNAGEWTGRVEMSEKEILGSNDEDHIGAKHR